MNECDFQKLIELKRAEINKIDDALAELFLKRLSAVKAIGEAKAQYNAPISDKKRESEILNRLTKNLSNSEAKYLKEIFSQVFLSSKEQEKDI